MKTHRYEAPAPFEEERLRARSPVFDENCRAIEAVMALSGLFLDWPGRPELQAERIAPSLRSDLPLVIAHIDLHAGDFEGKRRWLTPRIFELYCHDPECPFP